jgi:hypothetical protein
MRQNVKRCCHCAAVLRLQDPATRIYLGSPSLVRLPSGDLLATHDYQITFHRIRRFRRLKGTAP